MTSAIRLGEVASAIRGLTFSGADARGAPFLGGIACLTTAAVKPEIDWVSARFIPESLVRNPEMLVRPGDILVSTTNSREKVGTSVRIGAMPYQATFGAFVCVIRAGELVDSGYLSHWLRSAQFFRQARHRITQTTGFANLTISDLLTVEMPISRLEDQRRIAALLTSQLTAIEKIRDRAETRRAEASALASVVRATLLDGLTAPRERIGRLITEPGAIIDGPFGSNLKGDHYKSSGVRVIRLGNIGRGTFINLDRAYVTPAHAARLQRHRADEGDVVIAALGDGARPAGRACLVPSELQASIVKADCFRVRTAGSDLDGAFLVHVMNSPQTLEYIRASTRGATRPRMNLRMLKDLEIPVPSLEEQRRIVYELDAQLAVIGDIESAIRAEQEAIEALPAALLRRAFDDLAA